MSVTKLYTIEDIKEAYEDGFYELYDDLWYTDHDTKLEDGNPCGLNAEALVHKPMNKYIKDLIRFKGEEV